jgi:streptogramin lyase
LAVESRQHIARGIGPLAATPEGVWVADPANGEITRVSAEGRAHARLGGTPISLALGFGRLWVAERDGGRVVTLDPRTLALRTSTGISVPVAVLTGALGPWALSLDTASLYQLSPVTGATVAHPFDSPVADPSAMVMVGDELWVLGAGEHGLAPFNGRLGRSVRAGFSLPGRALSGLSAAGRTIWLGEPQARALLRVDTRNVAVRVLPAPNQIRPVATAVGACGVWVAGGSGDLAIIDPATGRPLGPSLHLGASLAAVAPAGRGVWVSDPLGGSLIHVEAR